MLNTIILLAKDKDGKPLFDKEDKIILKKRSVAHVMARVAGELLAAQPRSSAMTMMRPLSNWKDLNHGSAAA